MSLPPPHTAGSIQVAMFLQSFMPHRTDVAGSFFQDFLANTYGRNIVRYQETRRMISFAYSDTSAKLMPAIGIRGRPSSHMRKLVLQYVWSYQLIVRLLDCLKTAASTSSWRSGKCKLVLLSIFPGIDIQQCNFCHSLHSCGNCISRYSLYLH